DGGAGPLVRDPAEPDTLYAGFALTPYEEMWRMAVEGGSLLDRLDALSLAGGAAFLLVIALVAGVTLRRLGRHYRQPGATANWRSPRIDGSVRGARSSRRGGAAPHSGPGAGGGLWPP